MPEPAEGKLRFDIINNTLDHGIKILTKNSSRRLRSQFVHALLSTFLFLIFLFGRPNIVIDNLAPFVIPFLLFAGSLTTLGFYFILLDSDLKGYWYLRSVATQYQELQAPEICNDVFNAIKKANSITHLKQENFLYVSATTFIGGIFAIGSVSNQNWLTIIGVGICFLALGITFCILIKRELNRIDNTIERI